MTPESRDVSFLNQLPIRKVIHYGFVIVVLIEVLQLGNLLMYDILVISFV